MSRLVDADRPLSDRAKSTYYHLPNGDTAIPIIDIEHAPTVDAIEVVRCRDCKFYDDRPCGIVDWYNTASEFCSKAERRTDGNS